MLSRVDPMQDKCGAAAKPPATISLTTLNVRSRVEPPVPYVTEKKAGFSSARLTQVARSFSMPSGVCGGKNSIEISCFIYSTR